MWMNPYLVSRYPLIISSIFPFSFLYCYNLHFLLGNKKAAGSKAGEQAAAIAITKEELRDIR